VQLDHRQADALRCRNDFLKLCVYKHTHDLDGTAQA
jgi:hypothetical protein